MKEKRRVVFIEYASEGPEMVHMAFDQFSRFPTRAVFPELLNQEGQQVNWLSHLRCFWDGFLNQMRFPEFRFILKQLNVINQ